MIRQKKWAATALILGMSAAAGLLAAGPAPGKDSQSDHSQHTAQVPPGKSAAVKDEARAPIEVAPEQQSRIGLKTIAAARKPLKHTIRTVGVVAADQRTEAHVHTRINGWVERVFADFIGKEVKKGQPLFELYSPELVSTQEEYLAARRQGAAARELSKAALDRLEFWNVPESEIERLKATGKAKRGMTFVSPVDGFVVNKTAIQGMYVTPEMELYYIADLSKVWVIVTLYESDVAIVRAGDDATIQLSYDPARTYRSKISYIYPEVDPETRTAKARIEMANPGNLLKPGMFANVEVVKDLGEAIVLPDDSVIDTGTRRIVFVKSGVSRFEPREVKVGPRVGGEFAILSGVKEGDQVVTSAHFLIDAESKFQAATARGEGTGPEGAHGGHGGHP